MTARSELFERISAELDHAYAKHGKDAWGRHEFYGVLKEEVDELWDAIKSDAPMSDVLDELTQVAAMCFRYYETGDRYRGPHPERRDEQRTDPRPPSALTTAGPVQGRGNRA